MKRITLEEFAEIAKNDEALKEKMIQIAVMQEGSQTDEMIALAAEYGYELEKSPILDMEELSDDDLENVAGGIPIGLCETVMRIVGMGLDFCKVHEEKTPD